jgi:N-acetylglucosamine-6-sulfatase
VLLVSDNGYLHLEHGKRDKRLAYEASIRIPMLAWGGPVAKPGRTVSEEVLNIDVAPTMLDLAGLPIPATVQGRSLRPLLEARSVPWRSDFLYEYFHEAAAPNVPTLLAIRTPTWKYVEVPSAPAQSQLYNLSNDPAELHNLIDDKSYRGRLNALKRRLRALLTQLHAGPNADRPPRQ